MSSRLFVLLMIIVVVSTLLKEGASTHLDTCNCHEIAKLVNKAVQQAVENLQYKIQQVHSHVQRTADNLENQIEQMLKPIKLQLDYHLPQPNHFINPAKSCQFLFESNAPSGFYWITTLRGSPTRMYCNMEPPPSTNLTGGWARVAYIDMRNTSHQCPSGMKLMTRSSAPRRLCNVGDSTCVSTFFPVNGMNYSRVFGKIIAYQDKIPLAFYYCRQTENTIDKKYVYGVSLTYSQSPREHIWTFAGAIDETNSNPTSKCPCTNSGITAPSIPSFVGNDYFCDTGLSVFHTSVPKALQPNNPLWDGKGCGSTDTCCSFNNPPWFVKNLPSSTNADIEMRLCKPYNHGGTPFEIVELYIQ